MTSKCEICDEKLNNRTHAPINCPYCSYQSCRTCCETYILDQSVAKCMNPSCAKEWSRKFLAEKFPKSFICGSWKKHRENVLFEKELALLPATQAIIEEKKENEQLRSEITAEIANIDRTISEIYKNTIDELQHKRLKLRRDLNAIGIEKNDAAKTPKTFIRACSVEDCRGFLSTQWKCGLCDVYTCPDCHVTKGTERNGTHECKPDDLATAKLLATDTKCCPNCATGIFKIEGCDQMWCTQCHTAFSWNTGRIETRIHNPHYYEWHRQNGSAPPREAGDIQCGRELDYRFSDIMQTRLKQYLGINVRDKLEDVALRVFEEISDIVRSVIHLREVQLPRYRVDNVENNLDLRVKYLCKEIDKTGFQINIQRKNKKHEKHQEIYDVIQLLITTITDIMYRVRAELDSNTGVIDFTLKNITDIVRESDTIVAYVNACLVEISNTYNSKLKRVLFYNKNQKEDKWRHVLVSDYGTTLSAVDKVALENVIVNVVETAQPA